MAYTAPTVNYSTTIDGTYTTITGVQNVSISRGRQRIQDPFPSTTCTVEIIPANSYAVPFAIGQYIDVRTTNSSSAPCYFVGKITDIARSYDFPYNSGTGAAPGDRIYLTATGGTGQIGLNTLTGTTVSARASAWAANLIAFNLNVNSIYPITSAEASALNITGSALNAINQLANTGQFYVDDRDANRLESSPGFPLIIMLYGYGEGTAYTFRDTAGSGYKFNHIEYLSGVQSTFTQVQVNPEGLASQSASTGSAPFNTLVVDTYNATTTDAASLASYLLAMNQQPTPTPFSISSNTAVDETCVEMGYLNTHPLGNRGKVIFRGTTVNVVMEGVQTTFTPEGGAITLYFSPTFGQPFTLDSTDYGVLDTNRLGYP